MHSSTIHVSVHAFCPSGRSRTGARGRRTRCFSTCTRHMRFPSASTGPTSRWPFRNGNGSVDDQRLFGGGLPPPFGIITAVTLAFEHSCAVFRCSCSFVSLGDLQCLDSFAQFAQFFEGDLQVRALQRDHQHCTHPFEQLDPAIWRLHLWC